MSEFHNLREKEIETSKSTSRRTFASKFHAGRFLRSSLIPRLSSNRTTADEPDFNDYETYTHSSHILQFNKLIDNVSDLSDILPRLDNYFLSFYSLLYHYTGMWLFYKRNIFINILGISTVLFGICFLFYYRWISADYGSSANYDINFNLFGSFESYQLNRLNDIAIVFQNFLRLCYIITFSKIFNFQSLKYYYQSIFVYNRNNGEPYNTDYKILKLFLVLIHICMVMTIFIGGFYYQEAYNNSMNHLNKSDKHNIVSSGKPLLVIIFMAFFDFWLVVIPTYMFLLYFMIEWCYIYHQFKVTFQQFSQISYFEIENDWNHAIKVTGIATTSSAIGIHGIHGIHAQQSQQSPPQQQQQVNVYGTPGYTTYSPYSAQYSNNARLHSRNVGHYHKNSLQRKLRCDSNIGVSNTIEDEYSILIKNYTTFLKLLKTRGNSFTQFIWITWIFFSGYNIWFAIDGLYKNLTNKNSRKTSFIENLHCAYTIVNQIIIWTLMLHFVINLSILHSKMRSEVAKKLYQFEPKSIGYLTKQQQQYQHQHQHQHQYEQRRRQRHRDRGGTETAVGNKDSTDVIVDGGSFAINNLDAGLTSGAPITRADIDIKNDNNNTQSKNNINSKNNGEKHASLVDTLNTDTDANVVVVDDDDDSMMIEMRNSLSQDQHTITYSRHGHDHGHGQGTVVVGSSITSNEIAGLKGDIVEDMADMADIPDTLRANVNSIETDNNLDGPGVRSISKMTTHNVIEHGKINNVHDTIGTMNVTSTRKQTNSGDPLITFDDRYRSVMFYQRFYVYLIEEPALMSLCGVQISLRNAIWLVLLFAILRIITIILHVI